MLRKILLELPYAEIIMTFAVDYLIDYLSDSKSFKNTLRELGIGGYFDLGCIERLKNDSADWRFIIQSQLYKALVEGSGAKFFTPFFIRSKKSGKSYWLIHLSGHARARDEMTKLHWLKHTYFSHHGGAGLNMLGYDPGRDPEVTGQGRFEFMFDDHAKALTEEALLRDIPNVLSGKFEGMRFGSLMAGTCNGTPASSDIYKIAIGRLMEYGDVEVVGERGGRRRKEERISSTDVVRLVPQRRIIF